MWSYVIATIALVGVLAGIFWGGVNYGELRCGAAHSAQALTERDKVIGDLNQQIEARDEDVSEAQANMAQVQQDLAAIRRTAGSVGTQLRSALDASQMGTCLLDEPVRRVRRDDYEATAAAISAANRARSEAAGDPVRARAGSLPD